jgi:hypothetical protein
MLMNQSPIQKSYSDKDASVFYSKKINWPLINVLLLFILENENNSNPISLSNNSNTHNVEQTYNQRHNSADFETFCRQITESAINDDGKNSLHFKKIVWSNFLLDHDVSIDHRDDTFDIQNIKSSSNNSADIEQ